MLLFWIICSIINVAIAIWDNGKFWQFNAILGVLFAPLLTLFYIVVLTDELVKKYKGR